MNSCLKSNLLTMVATFLIISGMIDTGILGSYKAQISQMQEQIDKYSDNAIQNASDDKKEAQQARADYAKKDAELDQYREQLMEKQKALDELIEKAKKNGCAP